MPESGKFPDVNRGTMKETKDLRPMATTYRIDMTDESKREMEELKEDLAAPTNAEVIRRALRFLSYVRREQRKGNRIEVVEGDLRKELVTV